MKNAESVESIKKEFLKLGPMLPGKINTQWLRCGSKGCKCRSAKNPRKHGPYNQLSFSFAGKSSTMNIKKEDMTVARRYIENYKEFKELSRKLVLAGIAEIRLDGFKRQK